jgi:hypothetical protein
VTLVLLSLVACSPFGGRNTIKADEAAAATATPVPPTEVPPLATPTVVKAMATPTFTVTPTPEPSATPTTPPTPTPSPAPADATSTDAEAADTTSADATPAGETKLIEQPPAAPADTSGAAPRPVSPKVLTSGNLVRNGSFEDGFDDQGVAQGWTSFSSDNGAVFAWLADSNPMHVSHGAHAQVMRIMGPGQPNTFIGIYQTIGVVPGETYKLALHGVIRSSLAAENYDPLAFRVQYAIDETGGTDWEAVEWANWTDPGWNDVQLDVKWPPMDVYTIEYTPTTDKITLFIRGWSKWAFFQSEAKFFVDGIFVQGPMPAEGMPSTGGTGIWVPLAGLLITVGLAIWELRTRRTEKAK